jgi:hypothetical protein
LAAQEQVLDHEVVPLADEACQRGEEDAEQLEHPHSLADPAGSRFPLLQDWYRRPEFPMSGDDIN